MENIELRNELVKFIKRKFYSRPNIFLLADDIVNEAYAKTLKSNNFTIEKDNFGYMSVACLRVAYRLFMQQNSAETLPISLDECSNVVSEGDFVEDILKEEDTTAVINSFEVLRQIEKIIITERYYGNFTFSEIAQRNGIKLNTVLSHHRRALEKLKPALANHFNYKKRTYKYEGRI